MNKDNLLSERQKRILSFIRETLRVNGYPPSVREIGKAVGLSSSSTVHSHLAKLEELGFIRRDPTKPRAIELLDDKLWRQKTVTPVPLVGKVTAGNPILAVEQIEDMYPMPSELIGVKNDDVFMLSVRGSSMINAGIYDGDYILVKVQHNADNGDIVVALIDNEEATVKRFFKERDYIRLQPENDLMNPICSKNISVLGKVIGLYRKL